MSTNFNPLPHQPLLIVISGISGAGKDSVVKALQKRQRPIHFVITATDRPPRPGEVNGRDYIFVSRDEFQRMIDQDELLEHALVYNQHKGVPKAQVRQALASGKDVVMRVDVQGAATIRRKCPGAVLIFLTTNNQDELIRRLEARRTESAEEIQLRLDAACQELDCLKDFDYVVVNEDSRLEATVDAVEAIILAEHHRIPPRNVTL